MDLTTLVSGHLRYLGLGSPLIGQSSSIELQEPVWRLGNERRHWQLAQHLGWHLAEARYTKPRLASAYSAKAADFEPKRIHGAPSTRRDNARRDTFMVLAVATKIRGSVSLYAGPARNVRVCHH